MSDRYKNEYLNRCRRRTLKAYRVGSDPYLIYAPAHRESHFLTRISKYRGDACEEVSTWDYKGIKKDGNNIYAMAWEEPNTGNLVIVPDIEFLSISMQDFCFSETITHGYIYPTLPTLKQVEAAIEANDWVNAKTAIYNPHEYVVRKNWKGDLSYIDFIAYVREHSVLKVFGVRRYRQCYLGGRYYWTMGFAEGITIIINRSKPTPFG